MQSLVDALTVVCEPTGTKRAASPVPTCVSLCTPELHQLLPQHDSPCQAFSCKRRRSSNQHTSLNTQNTPSASARPPSIIWHDSRNREFEIAEEVRKPDHEALNLRDTISKMTTKTAFLFTSTQDSNPHSGLTASVSDQRFEELKSRILRAEEMKNAIENSLIAVQVSKKESLDQLQEQPLARVPSQAEEIDAFTKGRTEAVESRSATDKGLIGPQQRRPDHLEGHSRICNFYTKASILSSRGIVDLERVQVDERSLFNLLPWSIAISLNLILYSDKILTITVADRLIQTSQYCRFTIRVAGVDTTINTGVISGLQTVLLGQEWIHSVNLFSGFGNQSYYIPIPLAVEDAKERFPDFVNAKVEAKDIKLNELAMTNKVNEEYDDDDYGNDPLSDSELSLCEFSSNEGPSLDDCPLSDCGLSFGELSSDGQSSLDGGHSSDAEISSSKELNSDEHEFAPNDDDDEDYEDYEGYEEYEEGQEYQERQKEEDDTDANLQDFMKQHKHLEHAEPRQREAARETAKLAEQELHRLVCLKNSSDRNDESVGNQPEPKGEQAFPSSHYIDPQEQSATLSSNESETNVVQTPITTRQAKEIANILNHISRTQAGQSFKAPVEQLWPECADVYIAKVSNPIDLGTMEMKVKNNIYLSMDDFRADAILLYENSLDFNGIDHIITSAALEVKDTILKAIGGIKEGRGSTTLRASTRGL